MRGYARPSSAKRLIPRKEKSLVNAINDHREIVGAYDSGGHQGAFIATLPENGKDDRASGFVKVTYPGSNPDTDDLRLYGVNNAGEIVGAATLRGGTFPIELVNGVFQNINFGFDNNGGLGALAIAVNDAGFIVGGVGMTGLGLITEAWIPYRFYPGLVGASAAPAALKGWRPTNVLR